MMFGLCVWPNFAFGAKEAVKNKTPEMPDMAFLEFLAEMQEVDGNLVAPTDLLEFNKDMSSAIGPVANSESPQAQQNEVLTAEQITLLKMLNQERMLNEGHKTGLSNMDVNSSEFSGLKKSDPNKAQNSDKEKPNNDKEEDKQ